MISLGKGPFSPASRRRDANDCVSYIHTIRLNEDLTGLSTRREDSGKVEDLRKLGVREDAALHLLRRAVAAHLEETLLVVHNKQGDVVLVYTFVGECHRVVGG